MEFFSSNWVENLTKMLFVLICRSAPLHQKTRHNKCHKIFVNLKRRIPCLAKQFQVTYNIKSDDKIPKNNSFLYRFFCRKLWSHHNAYLLFRSRFSTCMYWITYKQMQKLNVDFSRHAMGRKCIARFVKHWINSTKQKKSILNICQKTIAIIFQQKCLKMKKIKNFGPWRI